MPANPDILNGLKQFIADKTGNPPPTGGDGKTTPPAPAKPATPIVTGGGTPTSPAAGKIPLPDYTDAQSRLKYAHAFRDKYGKQSLEGFGDIPLRINDKPWWGSDTSKNLAIKYAKPLGINPALFYASSMIEGQSGLYSNAVKGLPSNNVQYTGDKDYPVSGLWNFGLDSFQDYLPTLKKKGYLPADFDQNFKVWDKSGNPSDPNGREESVMFKTADAGIQAKAAMMRAFYDELNDYAAQKGVKLSPAQRDFFALAHFNSGEHGFQMLDAYNKAGLLKGNSFLTQMPNIQIPGIKPELHKEIYQHIAPRLAAARGLIGEGYFDETPPK